MYQEALDVLGAVVGLCPTDWVWDDEELVRRLRGILLMGREEIGSEIELLRAELDVSDCATSCPTSTPACG